MRKILFSALIIAASVGCTKQNEEVLPNSGLNEISLGSAIVSKAANDGDVAIDGLQFLRIDGVATTNDFTGKSAFVGSRAVGGAITFQGVQRYPAEGNAYLASYFPAGSVAENVVTWTIDGKTDIMTAAVIDAGSNASHYNLEPFAYQHELTQIELICKAEVATGAVQSYWGDVSSIKLSTPTTAFYAYNGFAVTPGTLGQVAFVKPGYTEDLTPFAIPAPGSVAVNAVGMFYPITGVSSLTLEIKTSRGITKEVVLDLLDGAEFVKSTRNTITLTFSGTDNISGSSMVNDWQAGATGSGTIK